MNRFSTRVLIAAMLCGETLAAGLVARAADDAGQAALQADHALAAALEKSDKNAAGKLLGADFVWTDGEGKSFKKADVLGDLSRGGQQER